MPEPHVRQTALSAPKLLVKTDKGKEYDLSFNEQIFDRDELLSAIQAELPEGESVREIIPRYPSSGPMKPPGFGELFLEEEAEGMKTGMEGATRGGLLGTAQSALGAARAFPPAAAQNAAARTAGHYVLDKTGSPVAAGLADAAVGVVPFGGMIQGASNLVSRGIKHLPSASTALNEMGQAGIREMGKMFRPAGKSQVAFNMLERMDVPPSRVTTLADKMDDLIGREGEAMLRGSGSQDMVDRLETLQKLIAQSPSGEHIPFHQLKGILEDYGKGSRIKMTGFDKDVAKEIFSAAADDLDRIAIKEGQPGAQLLKEARALFRKERASDELEEMIEGAIVPRQGMGRTVTEAGEKTVDTHIGNFANLQKQLEAEFRGNKLFKESYSPEERKKILDVVGEYAAYPVPRPPKGGMFGAGVGLARIGTAGGIAHALGAGPQVEGAVIAAASSIPYLFAKGLETEPGRKLLIRIARSGGFTPTNAALLAGLVRSGSLIDEARE